MSKRAPAVRQKDENIMAIPRNVFGQLAEAILEAGAKRATKYISSKEVVKATLQGRPRKNDRSRTILFTIGAPNYEERQFIARWKGAERRFPIHQLQVKWPRPTVRHA